MERRSLLRPLAFAALVFGAVWCAMILRWRASNRVPNGVDVGLYLVALPLGLLLGFVLLRKGIDAAKRRRETAATAPDDADAPAPTAPHDPSLAWRLPILAADALLAAGDSPAALAAAASAAQRPALHPQLRDSQGLPVFAAEVADVDTDALDASLPDEAQDWDPSRLRTLALAGTLAERMLEEHFEPLRAATTARAPTPALTLEWLLPARWNDAERQTAQAWLAGRLAAQGWAAPQLALDVRAIDEGAAALRRLDELNCAFNGDATPGPRLLLASDSNLDEATLRAWEAARRLHGARRPEGQVPGEGAAALLLAAPSPRPETAQAHLHRLRVARRERPVDAPQRLQADTLRELLGHALAQAGLEAGAAAPLVGDTDLRGSRTAEAMHLAEQALPEHDPAEALLPLGVANGECGAALALALVAVAAQLAAETQQPAAILSHHDASLRAVAVVTPPTANAPGTTTPSLA